jgi:hypothetical protein
MPRHAAGPDTRGDPIRLTNLIDEAEAELTLSRWRGPGVSDLLKPLRVWATGPDSAPFWRSGGSALAAYIAPGFQLVLDPPCRLSELSLVGRHFHIKPLLGLLHGDGRFFVFAVSKNATRLLECSRESFKPIQPPDTIAQTCQEAIQGKVFEKSLQTRTAVPQPSGRDIGMTHGHAVGVDDRKDDLLSFFRQLGLGLRGTLRGSDAPLVLAAVDYYLPLLRQTIGHGGILEAGIQGNPDNLTDVDLHASAWRLVAPLFEHAKNSQLERYKALKARGLAVNDLDIILDDAAVGRLDVLFAVVGQERWGRRLEEKRLLIQSERQPGDEDLCNTAAVATLTHGGAVYTLSPQQVADADASPVLAIRRWNSRNETQRGTSDAPRARAR